MLQPFFTLAQDSGSGEPGNGIALLSDSVKTHLDLLTQPEMLAQSAEQLHLVWASIFIVVGAACIVNGYRWHKYIVVVLAGMAGFWAGQLVAPQIGNPMVASSCLAVLCAVLAWPLLRYSVALFGALAGAFAGANLWSALEMGADQHKLGAAIGMVVMGMLAFMAFRTVVIVMTTVGGASLLAVGGLAAIMEVETWRASITDGLTAHPRAMPAIVGSLAVIGSVVQFSGGVKGMASMADRADTSKAKEKKAA